MSSLNRLRISVWPECLAAIALMLLELPPYPTAFSFAVFLSVFIGLLALQLPHVRLHWLASRLDPLLKTAKIACYGWPIAGSLFLIMVLTFLEIRQPLYFVQDDNHSQFLPVLIDAMQHAFNEWTLPTWNAFQSFGYPSASIGVFTLTYPPTYLAYALACLAGHPLYMIDIFAWMHLLAGYALFYFVLYRNGLRPSLAAAVSFCFTLNGFHLISGRSWFIVLPLAVYLPALVGSLLAFQRETVTGRWVFWSGLSMGAWFHSGHAQIWFYGMVLWGLGLAYTLIFSRGRRFRLVLLAAAAGCLTLAVAMPLFYIQYIEQTRTFRDNWLFATRGIFDELSSVLLPAPFAFYTSSFPPKDINLAFFCNTFFFAAFLLFLALSIVRLAKHPDRRSTLKGMLPCLLTVFALLWAFGNESPIWAWLSIIPPFNKFSNPDKLVPFVIIFSLVTGGQWWERLGRIRQSKKFPLWTLAILSMLLSAYHAGLCTIARYNFSDPPYPKLPPQVRQLRLQGNGTNARRVFSLANNRSLDKDFVFTLINNYASVYKIFSANGYCDFVTQSYANRHAREIAERSPQIYLPEYGIAWLMLAKPNKDDWSYYPSDPVIHPPHVVFRPTDPKYQLMPIASPGTKPLVYREWQNRRIEALPFYIVSNGLEISLPGNTPRQNLAFTVVANFLYRDWFQAFSERGVKLNITVDDFGRIVIPDAGNSHIIKLLYLPPWGRSWILAALFLGLAVLLWQLGNEIETQLPGAERSHSP